MWLERVLIHVFMLRKAVQLHWLHWHEPLIR